MEPSFDTLALQSLTLETFLAVVALCAASLSGRPLVGRLGLARSALSWPVLALLIAGTLSLSYALHGIIELSGLWNRSSLADFEAQLVGVRGESFALALFAFGLAPGVAEELLCRGWLQRGLAGRIGPASAIAVAAIVFGALHGDLVHGASAAVLGLYLGTAAQLSGGIRAAIACHVVNNSVAVGSAAIGANPAATNLAGIFASAALSAVAIGLAARSAARGRSTLAADSRGEEGGDTELQPRGGSDES